MRYKTIFFLSVYVFLWPVLLNAQPYERSKEETRSFKVYKQTTLEIYNKYGNIHLFPWEKDSVKIKIELNNSLNQMNEELTKVIMEYQSISNFQIQNITSLHVLN